jgi:hypothetical protein
MKRITRQEIIVAGQMRRLLFQSVALAVFLLCNTAGAKEALLQLAQTIPLTGIEGRIDHLAFDPIHSRLFVCALGNNTVEVLDLIAIPVNSSRA